ncbi:hypothetical protein [Segatella bryantii]|uniref:Uncharacterized protein n=1 Tax=Segatella bryantii TaxID=77095 RepID=A0ABX4EF79_SEGBR|nr:hypothetical protein [Segatella bryantii]OYP53177.1 hypothetical protein CIK91_13315 [Segatella bryantii]UKK80523.1 hypothetical protein L6474_07620 [Segatella bryantii]
MEACQKRGVAASTWTVNGGFVVVTFKRPTKSVPQGVPQDVPQDDTQDGTQGGTQGDTQGGNLDKWIEN